VGGQSTEQAANVWQNESKIARLAARRTPIEEAQNRIAELLTGEAPHEFSETGCPLPTPVDNDPFRRNRAPMRPKGSSRAP
jgi:hypothetical protein